MRFSLTLSDLTSCVCVRNTFVLVRKIIAYFVSGLQLVFRIFWGTWYCFPGYSHRHAAFPVRLTRLFAHVLCNSPYGLKQTQNMSGSVLLTTEASQLSVRIVEEAAWCKIFQAKSSVQFLISDKSLMKSVLPFVRRFSTPTLFHMTILISCSAKHPHRNVLESVYIG